jgi:hypothetical protein
MIILGIKKYEKGKCFIMSNIKKICVFLFVLSLILYLPGCKNETDYGSDTGTVTGQLIYWFNADPISNVIVKLDNQEVVSDENGYFTFYDVNFGSKEIDVISDDVYSATSKTFSMDSDHKNLDSINLYKVPSKTEIFNNITPEFMWEEENEVDYYKVIVWKKIPENNSWIIVWRSNNISLNSITYNENDNARESLSENNIYKFVLIADTNDLQEVTSSYNFTIEL